MSGGSHDYLCFKTAEDLLSRVADLELMAQDVEQYIGGRQAAGETRKVISMVEALARQIAALEDELTPLQDVWRAVEWHHSGDVGIASVLEEINGFNEERDA